MCATEQKLCDECSINNVSKGPLCSLDYYKVCPGHSPVQEVDNVHSHIEKTLKCKEVYNPPSLVRVLKHAKRKHRLRLFRCEWTLFFTINGLERIWDNPVFRLKGEIVQNNEPMTIGFKTSLWWTIIHKWSYSREHLTRQCGLITPHPASSPLNIYKNVRPHFFYFMSYKYLF